jgi:hypothetical protein
MNVCIDLSGVVVGICVTGGLLGILAALSMFGRHMDTTTARRESAQVAQDYEQVLLGEKQTRQ